MEPIQEDLLTHRIDDLNNQMQILSSTIKTITQQPPKRFWSDSLFDRGPKMSLNPTNLASVLHFFDRNIRRLVAVYYLIFGTVYLRTGLAILTATSRTASHAPPLIQLVIALLYILVGLGNFSCIFFASKRHQQAMILPTIFVAILAFIITVLSPDLLINIILSTAFWLAIIAIHIAFGSTISARIGLRNFTIQLAEASQAQHIKQSHEQ